MSGIIQDPKSCIPEIWQNVPAMREYAELIDRYHEEDWLKILGIKDFLNPWKTPYPNLLAAMFGAYPSPDDNTEEIRRKAGSAVRFHKYHTVFDEAWKPVIDRITGRSSQIWRRLWYSGGFVIGEDRIGLERIGDNPSQIDLWYPGLVLIDCGGNIAPSDEEIRLIRNQFAQVKTVYMRFFLGHVELDFVPVYYETPYHDPEYYITDTDVFILKEEIT